MGRDSQQRASRKSSNKGTSAGIARLRGGTDETGHEPLRLSQYPRILPAIDSIIRTGDAVILGRTRDGGAVCLTILSGEEREKLYASDEAELVALVDAIAGAYELDDSD